jgi:hypothetical protein
VCTGSRAISRHVRPLALRRRLTPGLPFSVGFPYVLRLTTRRHEVDPRHLDEDSMAAALAGVGSLNGPFVASESRGSIDVTRREWSRHGPPTLPAPSHCPLVDRQHPAENGSTEKQRGHRRDGLTRTSLACLREVRAAALGGRERAGRDGPKCSNSRPGKRRGSQGPAVAFTVTPAFGRRPLRRPTTHDRVSGSAPI